MFSSLTPPFGMMPGRSGYSTMGGWAGGGVSSAGLPNNLNLDRRIDNEPLEYRAAQSIEFTGNFESGSGDSFEAFITTESGTGGGSVNGTDGAEGLYRYGFNGQEHSDDVTAGNYNAEYWEYDSRIGRRWNLYPVLEIDESPYLCFAGNPILLKDPNGDTPTPPGDPTPDKILNLKNQVNMSGAKPTGGTTVTGAPRNFKYFWKESLKSSPEMFSISNKNLIASGKAPVADAQWVKFNPQHQEVLGLPRKDRLLIHHHIGQGEMATGLPRKMHTKYSKILHPFKSVAAYNVSKTTLITATTETVTTSAVSVRSILLNGLKETFLTKPGLLRFGKGVGYGLLFEMTIMSLKENSKAQEEYDKNPPNVHDYNKKWGTNYSESYYKNITSFGLGSGF